MASHHGGPPPPSSGTVSIHGSRRFVDDNIAATVGGNTTE